MYAYWLKVKNPSRKTSSKSVLRGALKRYNFLRANYGFRTENEDEVSFTCYMNHLRIRTLESARQHWFTKEMAYAKGRVHTKGTPHLLSGCLRDIINKASFCKSCGRRPRLRRTKSRLTTKSVFLQFYNFFPKHTKGEIFTRSQLKWLALVKLIRRPSYQFLNFDKK
jgi:hypothetical protein